MSPGAGGQGGGFADRLHERARAARARIGFPEPEDGRVASAMRDLARDELADPIPFEGVDALERAAVALAAGELDGVVAGAVTPTADVIRAGLRSVGVAPGFRTVSSAFYMILGRGADERVLTFTDPGVVPCPTAEQLAESADAACTARALVVGDEPRVAFLSYSTRGSASGEVADRMRAALALFLARRPDVAADGELQVDAALVPDVASRKATGSIIAGRANVLVFPDLASGNIGYKLVERLAGARALGPVLQGLAAPLNDLSRGASAADIVDVACITAIMVEGLTE